MLSWLYWPQDECDVKIGDFYYTREQYVPTNLPFYLVVLKQVGVIGLALIYRANLAKRDQWTKMKIYGILTVYGVLEMVK